MNLRRGFWAGMIVAIGLAFAGMVAQHSATAGIVNLAGPRLFTASGGGGGGSFPTQSTGGAVSMVPGAYGFGYDNYGGSGRDGAEGRVTVFLIDEFTSGTVSAAVSGYTRILHGNIGGCAAASSPKVCIPIEEGIIDLDTDIRPGSYFDYYGQFAPGIGVIWRHTIPNPTNSFCSSVATNQRWWHGDFRVGDDAPGIASGERDAAYLAGCSDAGSPAVSNIAWINNFIGWSVDEAGDGYYCGDNFAFHGNVIAEAFDLSIHDDTDTPDDGTGVDRHGYGPIMGEGYRCDHVAFQRNVFAHLAGRQPNIAVLNFAFANNISYNTGDSDSNIGQIVRLNNDYGAATPGSTAMYANIVRNLFMAGPNSAGTVHAITVDPTGGESSTRLPAGSQGYIADNAVRGWTYASQTAMKSGTFPSGFDAGAVISAAMPTGWGSDLSGLLDIGSGTNPNDFSDADMLTFATTVCNQAGPRPDVTDSSNRARTVCGHIINRLDGVGDEGQVVNSVSGTSSPGGGAWPNISLRFTPNAGGYPTAGSGSIDVFTGSGIDAGAMPLNGTTPDDRVQASGTFCNGFSAVGYTAIEKWAGNQHLYRIGECYFLFLPLFIRRRRAANDDTFEQQVAA